MDCLVPSSTDLDHRILQLLEEHSEPITAAFIGFALSEYPFETVSNSLDALWRSGRITLDSYGYSVSHSAVGSLFEPESTPAANEEVQRAIPPDQEDEQQKKQDSESLRYSEGEPEGSSCPPPSPSTIAFSNKLRPDEDLRVFLASTPGGEGPAETDPQPDPLQLHGSHEEIAEAIDPHVPASAAEGEVTVSAGDAATVSMADDSPTQLSEPSAATESAPATPYETVVASLVQDGLDGGLDEFSDIPFIGAPRQSFRDDTELLYAKLSGTTIGDGLDQYPEEALIGLPHEETDNVSAEHIEMLEGYSSPEDCGARQTTIRAHRTSQVQDEHQALLDMLFAESIEIETNDESAEQDDGHAQEAEKKEKLPQAPRFTCWTPISALKLPSRAANALSGRSITTIRDLVKVYDSLDCERGVGSLTLRDIGNELMRHSSDVSASVTAEQIRCLCRISGSRKYVFDVFGQLRRVTSRGLINLPANGRQTPSPNSESTADAVVDLNALPISILDLPHRLHAALSREGYRTIGDVANLTEGELLSMRGVGERAIFQLQEALDGLTSKMHVDGIRTDSSDDKASPYMALFSGLKDDPTPVMDLGLPNRLTNVLRREGYRTVGEVAVLSDEEVLSFRGVGILAVEQLHQALGRLYEGHAEGGDTEPTMPKVDDVDSPSCEEAPANSDVSISDGDISKSASQGAALALDQCKACRYPIFDDSFLALEPLAALQGMGEGCAPTEYRDYILNSLEASGELEEACAAVLSEMVKRARVFDSTEEFLEDIDVPDVPEWDKAARKVAKESGWCSYEPETHSIAVHHPHLMDWLETSGNDERTLTILRMFLSGQTLEACGQEVGLSRERVRQIVSRRLNEAPFVEENRYRYFYETYSPSKTDFLSVTGEPVGTYIYLRTTERSKREAPLPYGNALNDKRVPQHVRDGIRRILDKGYIYADGFRILARRDAIINHIAMRHASARLVKVSKFRELYDQFLEDNGLSDIEEYQFNTMHSFEAYIDRCEQILKLPHSTEAKFGGSIRYYDASSMDFAPLVKLLSSGIIKDVECSASMLMGHEAFADVLEELDIRNGYELHYILGRYCPNVDGIRVGRSPNITFGKGNRNDQILEMIKELSPVSAQDLADAYSRRYGVDPATFMGSYLSAFKIYLKHGKYVYNDQGLSEEQASFVRDQLEGFGRDYVSVSLLKARFKNRFPHSSTTLINGESVACFGFHPSAGLLVKDGIDERTMFASLLDSKQRFSISDDEFGKDVFDNPSFQAELAIRVRACRLVEFEKDSYLASSIFSSQHVDLDETDLSDYVDRAIEFMEPNMPYTVKSLVGSGFTHKIDALRDDFGLDDYFFASLLGTGYVGGRLKGTSVGDTPVFCKTFYNYSAPIMLEQIVAQEEAIEVDDLSYMLEETYGIHANNALLRSIIKRADLYFSETLDMVFDSKETYRRKAQEWIS